MVKILRYAARSDVGRVRSKNDDSAYVGKQLAVVADGMGGHAGGNVASASTVLDLVHLDRGDHPDAETVLADEIQTANSLLSDLVRSRPELTGMGTTVTALLLNEDVLHFAHIGDSRAYRLKDDVFEQISVDHTFVQRLIDEGRLRPEDAETHPHKNVLMRVLGDVDASPELDLSSFPADDGERWMLCSDGLNAVVDADTIESIVRHAPTLQACVDQLVDMTLDGGSPDNVTVVVFEVAEAGANDTDTARISLIDESEAARPGIEGAIPPEPSDRDADGTTAPEDEDTEESRHFNAAVLQSELSSRPHQLVGAAAIVAETGELPTVAKRTAARRAAMLLTHKTRVLPPEAQDELEDPPRSGRRWFTAATAALVAVFVVLGLWGAYAWTQSRYYVGEYQSHVAIFEGVSQTLGPISLSEVKHETDISVADLPEYSRQRVEQTIPADNLDHARQIVADLQLSAPESEPDCPPSRPGAATGSTGPTQSPNHSRSDAKSHPDTPAKPRHRQTSQPSSSLRPGGSATKPPTTVGPPGDCGGTQ